MKIIDKEIVMGVDFNSAPKTYDQRMHAACCASCDDSEFIIVNPLFDNWVLKDIDTAIDDDRCVMWSHKNLWLAKKFKRSWNPTHGWTVIEHRIDVESNFNVKIEFNNDLPDLFPPLDYKIRLEDIKLEHIWFLDPRYFTGDLIWVYKLSAIDNTSGNKKMGYFDPAISNTLDVIFISYNEPDAEHNWYKVKEKAPWAKRVHGVKGIFEAHKSAAALATTDMFWVVDGDAEILDNWDFNFQPNIFSRDIVHVWPSQNPINGLEYGNGGVKLFPRQMLLDATTWDVDMTTSVGSKLKVMHRVSNITRFNTDPFTTWRSAFRECAKLAAGTIKNQIVNDNDERLARWCSDFSRDAEFGDYAIQGARSGRKYGLDNKDNIELLKKINDYEWLKEKFNNETT